MSEVSPQVELSKDGSPNVASIPSDLMDKLDGLDEMGDDRFSICYEQWLKASYAEILPYLDKVYERRRRGV